MARSIRRPATSGKRAIQDSRTPRRIAEFRPSQERDSGPPRCTGQMIPWNSANDSAGALFASTRVHNRRREPARTATHVPHEDAWTHPTRLGGRPSAASASRTCCRTAPRSHPGSMRRCCGGPAAAGDEQVFPRSPPAARVQAATRSSYPGFCDWNRGVQRAIRVSASVFTTPGRARRRRRLSRATETASGPATLARAA